jgi:transposase
MTTTKEVVMAIRYRVTLTDEERAQLQELTKDGKTLSKKFLNCRALLLCDASEAGPHWNVRNVAEALGVSSRTIEHLKERFVEDGLEVAIGRKQRETPPVEVKYDGAFDARLTQLACSSAPAGHNRWTVRLLSEKVVELGIAPSCTPMAVCRSLKKTNFSLIEANTGKSRRMKTQTL